MTPWNDAEEESPTSSIERKEPQQMSQGIGSDAEQLAMRDLYKVSNECVVKCEGSHC